MDLLATLQQLDLMVKIIGGSALVIGTGIGWGAHVANARYDRMRELYEQRLALATERQRDRDDDWQRDRDSYERDITRWRERCQQQEADLAVCRADLASCRQGHARGFVV